MGNKTHSSVFSEIWGNSPKQVDYTSENAGMLITDPTKPYAGMGELLKNLQPQKNPQKEKELQRIAKTAAWMDVIKTLGEGIAMTIGQNTGYGATPNIAKTGANQTILNANSQLEKMKDDYQNQNNLYTQQLLAQKLREANAISEAERYNAGLKMQQEKDNAANSKYYDSAKYQAWVDEQNAIAAKNRADKENERYWNSFNTAQKEKEAAKFGILDPYGKTDEDKRLIFDDESQIMMYYNALINNHPELRNATTDRVTYNEQTGEKTVTKVPVGSDISAIKQLIVQVQKTPKDYNDARTILNKKDKHTFVEEYPQKPVVKTPLDTFSDRYKVPTDTINTKEKQKQEDDILGL